MSNQQYIACPNHPYSGPNPDGVCLICGEKCVPLSIGNQVIMRPNTECTYTIINQLKQRIEVMQLWLQGHPIEFRRIGDLDEVWYSPKDPDWEPVWDWDHTYYRIRRTI